jgi:O-antigen/teichoic acid export membrane protein
VSLIPAEADPLAVALSDEVHVAGPSVGHDTADVAPLAWVDLCSSEDSRRRRWWRLGPYIDRVRGDSLLRNALFMMANTGVSAGVGYVFWLLTAHLYSAPVVGLTAAVISAGTIIVLLSSAGVSGAFIQSLPEQSTKTGWSATFWAGMAAVTFFTVALCAIALVVLPLWSSNLIVLRSMDYGAVFAVGTLALAAGSTLDYVYVAERRAGDMFSRNTALGAVKVILIGLVGLSVRPDAVHLLGAWGASSLFGLCLGAALLVRYRRVARPPKPSVLVQTALRLRGRITGNQVIAIAGSLLPYVLPVLVTVRLSPADNAYFYTAWTLAGVVLVVSSSVSMSLFAEGVHRPDEVNAMARSALKIIGAILVPGVITVFAVGATLLSTFGQAYADHAIGLLRLTVLATIPDAVICVYTSILRAQGRLTTVGLLYLGISVGTCVMSWFLMPVLGIIAVGWAFVAMKLCGCVYVVVDMHRHRWPKPKRLRSGSHHEEARREAAF